MELETEYERELYLDTIELRIHEVRWLYEVMTVCPELADYETKHFRAGSAILEATLASYMNTSKRRLLKMIDDLSPDELRSFSKSLIKKEST